MNMEGQPPGVPDPTDENDLERLYLMYGQVIYIQCRRFFHDASEAEDATQEIFLQVHRVLAKVPRGDDALRWLRHVAKNTCLNLKKRAWRRLIPMGTLDDAALVTACAEVRVIDGQLLAKLLAGAKKPWREVAELYYLRDLDQDEAAAELGLSRRTVNTRLHRFNTYAQRFMRRAGS